MSAPPLLRRVLGAALVTAAVAGVVTTAATSAAASVPVFVEPTAFARTDSSRPNATITTGDALVGAHRDDQGATHVSRAYFTFDVSRLHGTSIVSAELNILELGANDCAVARATELWSADVETWPPTWANPPEELTRPTGPDPSEPCAPRWLGWDLGATVRQAVADGRDTVTLVLRVADAEEDQVAAGRTYDTDTGIAVVYNTAPNVPVNPRVGHWGSPTKDCAAGDLYASNGEFSTVYAYADVSDPDGSYGLSSRATFWSVADPSQRREVVGNDRLAVPFPRDLVVDGGTYAWQARAEDADGAVSAWTAPCLVTIDNTSPTTAPTVTSTDYPESGANGGGEGVPGDFTFSANGDTDVVFFDWYGSGVSTGKVAADQPGGSATVSITPTYDGLVTLTVVGVDRAGNRSASTNYSFWVSPTAPRVSAGSSVRVGEPLPATFRATQTDAQTFTYRVDELAETTVPVGSDGTAAVDVQVPTSAPYEHRLSVWSTNSAGQRSAITESWFFVDPA